MDLLKRNRNGVDFQGFPEVALSTVVQASNWLGSTLGGSWRLRVRLVPYWAQMRLSLIVV